MGWFRQVSYVGTQNENSDLWLEGVFPDGLDGGH